MTDEVARQQVERTEAFVADFRELIASTVVDPASPCEAACLRGLERIAATAGAVDYVTFCNLANWPPPKRQPQARWRLFHRGGDVQHSQGQVHVLNWHLRYGHAAQVSDRWDRPPINKEKQEKSS